MQKLKWGWYYAVIVLIFAFSSPPVSADNGSIDRIPKDGAHEPHVFSPKGGARSRNTNLIDHFGPVAPNSNIHAIYWGNFSGSDIPAALESFYDGFSDSTYANIVTQYMHQSTPSIPTTNYADGPSPILDTSTPPSGSPSVGTIVNEACSRLVGGATPDPNGVYVVVTSSFPRHVNFCAWHSYGTCNGQVIPVIYLPNPTNIGGCDVPSLSGNSFSNGAQSMVNLAAHETSETITDPFLNAWYDQNGQEIGDKCAWMFGTSTTLTNNTSWWLQEEWSNANGSCVQYINP